MLLDNENEPLFEMGTWAGRRQAFGVIANKCSAADAECLKSLRESKQYKAAGLTWEEFCSRYIGISRTHADRLISQLEEFGAAYFDLSKQMRIPADAFRDIAGAIAERSIEHNGEKILISAENSHRIADVVSALRRQAVQPNRQALQKLRRRLNTCFSDLAAMDSPSLQPDDRAAVASLIASSLERLSQLSETFRGSPDDPQPLDAP
jgi:hypothetical protein